MNSKQDFTLIIVFKDEPIQENLHLLSIKKIFPLTPNAYSKVRHLKRLEIIDINSILTDKMQKEVLFKIEKFEKILEKELSKELNISAAGRDAARNSIYLLISTFFTIQEIIKLNGPWVIYDGRNWKHIYDINLAVEIIFMKIHKRCYSPLTKLYDQKGKFIVKILNKAIFHLLKNRKIIWLSGNSKVYNFFKIASEIQKLEKSSIFIYCEKPDKFSIFRSIKGFVKLLFNYNKKNCFVGMVPIIVEANNYSVVLSNIIQKNKINMSKRLESYFSITTSNLISNSESSVKYLTKVFEQLKPKCVILHHARWENATNLGLSAKNSNIKSYLISHGSHTIGDTHAAKLANRTLSRGMLDSNLDTISVIQSPLAMETYKFQNISSKYIVSKPIMWGQYNLQAPQILKKTFIILHAGTYKRLGSRLWIYENASEYLLGIKLLINAVKNIDNVKLIVRVREEPVECDLETISYVLQKNNSWELSSSNSFNYDLNRSDMLISFSSTTIEEALYAKKPVGLFGGSSRYKHIVIDNKNIKTRKALYYLDKNNLEMQIKRIKKLHFNKPLKKHELKNLIWNEKPFDPYITLKKMIT